MIQIDGYLIHSIHRALDRYGLRISEDEYSLLSERIAYRDQGCVKLKNAAEGREKWAIWFKGEWIPVVFDPVQGRIVTILPKQELRPHSRKLPW